MGFKDSLVSNELLVALFHRFMLDTFDGRFVIPGEDAGCTSRCCSYVCSGPELLQLDLRLGQKGSTGASIRPSRDHEGSVVVRALIEANRR